MYWSPAQMLAHLTVNGAQPAHRRPVRASGTISGTEPRHARVAAGADLERPEPLTLADGSTRGFLQDGDTVRHDAPRRPGAAGGRVALGEVSGTVVPGA